jgi:hypothetical protein
MTKVHVFHNTSDYASFGLNEGPNPHHGLVWVFEYDTPEAGDPAVLNSAFEVFNIGEDELAASYRARRLRSLSVGDVLVIDAARAYSCEKVGWEPRKMTELFVLPADAAEDVIRSRYGIPPKEALSITVPLAQ